MSTYNTLHVQRRTLLAVLVVFVLFGFSGNVFAETSQKVLDKKDTTAVLGIVKSVSIGSAVLKLDNGDEVTIKTSGAAIRKTDTVKPSKVESSVRKDKKSENR